MGVSIEAAATVTEEARSLRGELETVLSAEYPPEQRHGLALDAIFQPHIRFFRARLGGAAGGCGGVALYADLAEVKRMYVRDAARGQGVADAILARLEEEARVDGALHIASGNGRAPGRGDATLCASRVPSPSRVRRLCSDGAAIDCDQCVLRKTDLRASWAAAKDASEGLQFLSFAA